MGCSLHAVEMVSVGIQEVNYMTACRSGISELHGSMYIDKGCFQVG